MHVVMLDGGKKGSVRVVLKGNLTHFHPILAAANQEAKKACWHFELFSVQTGKNKLYYLKSWVSQCFEI